MPRPQPVEPLERRFDLTVPVVWETEPPEVDREAVERTVREAVLRAVEGFRAGAPRALAGGEAAAGSGGAGEAAAGDGYAVPSYDDDGEPVEIPVLEPEPGFEEDEGLREGPAAEEGAGALETQEVFEEASPFEGRLVAIFPRWRSIAVRSDRYAVARSLARAIAWGEHLFGGRSFVVVQGPLSGRRSGERFYAVATDELVRNEHLRLRPFRTIAGQQTVVAGGTTHWERALEARDGEVYRLRGLSSVEGGWFFPPEEELFAEFVRELRAASPEEVRIDRETARRAVFGEIDRLLASGLRRETRERLVDLDAAGFALLDWEAKVLYLELLLEGRPGEREEEAILEIFKAVAAGGRRSELDAIVELLERRGFYAELFDDMDRVWSLLVLVGLRFGTGRPLTVERLFEFLDEAGLIPEPGEIAGRIVLGPAGALVTSDLVAETEEAVLGFVRFLGGAYDSVKMLLTEPDRVVEGVAQLVRLAVAAQLAAYGHRPSQELIAEVARSAGRQVMAGFEGGEILGVEARVVRRIKWAVIWEVASLFIGVGEVKAALTAVGLTRRTLALGRIGRILGLAGEVGPAAGRTLRNVERVAAAIARARPGLGNADEVATLLSRLPEDEVRRLGRLLEGLELDETTELADLGRVSAELRRATDRVTDHAGALRVLAVQTGGGLTDEVAEVYATLSRTFGMEPGAVERIAWAIPEGGGGRFLAVVRTLPGPSPRLRGAAGADFLQTIAASGRRMDAVLDAGPGPVLALWRSSGGRLDVLDSYLQAIEAIRDAFPVDVRASEYRRFLTRLEFDDASALIRLEDRRRRVAGEPQLTGLEEALQGDFLAESGFRRLVRGRHDAVLDKLLEDLLRERPDALHGLLARIGALTDEAGLAGLLGRGLAPPHTNV